MSNEPKVSIVTPSFNQAQFLESTLVSIDSQTYRNVEHIVIDGGSTDGSVDILRRHAAQLAYWVSEPDDGQTDALIKGFSRATGDILCWLNSDDVLEPWTISEVVEFFERHPKAQAVYGDSLWTDKSGAPLKPKKEHAFHRFIWMYDHNFIPQPSTFWRRELYEAVGGLDPTFDLAMDADLWIRFSDVTKIHHVRRQWSRMRFYPEQKNQRLRQKSDQEDKVIRSRYLRSEPELALAAKKAFAKCARITLKLVNGSYW